MANYVNRTQEILEAGAQAQGRVTEYYFGQIDSLKEKAEFSMEERTSRAWAAHDATNGMLSQAIEQRNETLEKREGELRRRLFGAPAAPTGSSEGQQFGSALAQAALATDEQLASMAEMAAKTGSSHLAKAAFATAHERGLGGVMNTYLQNNPADRDYFEELSYMPDAEQREQVLRTAGTVLPGPTTEQVRPSPSAVQRSMPRPLAG